MCMYQDVVFSAIIIYSIFFRKWFPILFFWDPFIYFIHYFCQFPLTLSCSLCIHFIYFKDNIHVSIVKYSIWTISNSSVFKDIINVFLLYNNFKLTWLATGCFKSQKGPREAAGQSPTSRQPVPDQLQNLVATPLRSLWILVAERSQSGCSVCVTEA